MLKFPAINDRLHELLAEDPENRVPRVWEVMFPVPSQNGLRGEKRFLQHLQLGCPTRRWVLKSPDHVYGLEELLAVFPDAVIIQTHRNPLEVLRSSIQLTEVLQGLFGRVGDRGQLRMREAWTLAEAMERITRFRDARPELAGRFIDVKYREHASLVA
jgi:hypothetical protein